MLQNQSAVCFSFLSTILHGMRFTCAATLSELEMRVLMILEDIFSYEKTVSLLVPSMNSQLFVPISEVLKIEPLKYMTQDAELIARLLKKSERIIVSEDGKSIRPNVPVPQRTTLILRDIPTSTPEEVRLFALLPNLILRCLGSACPF